MRYETTLPVGYRLHEYEIVRVLGAGGFGITYLGHDAHLKKSIAIKEYLPSDLAVRKENGNVVAKSSRDQTTFDWGLNRFLEEARVLALFDQPNLLRVHRFFEANGTAYIVNEYIEGNTLEAVFAQRQTPFNEEQLKAIIFPLLDGLETVHEVGYLHRDIKPANIMIRDDGNPVLLDFGAARAALGVKSRNVTSIVTPGYAPIEQYSPRGNQGPWTDLYAIAAVMYRALTRQVPADATERVRHDLLTPVSELARNQASSPFLEAVDWALSVDEKNRPRTIEEWRLALETNASTKIAVVPQAVAADGSKSVAFLSATAAITVLTLGALTSSRVIDDGMAPGAGTSAIDTAVTRSPPSKPRQTEPADHDGRVGIGTVVDPDSSETIVIDIEATSLPTVTTNDQSLLEHKSVLATADAEKDRSATQPNREDDPSALIQQARSALSQGNYLSPPRGNLVYFVEQSAQSGVNLEQLELHIKDLVTALQDTLRQERSYPKRRDLQIAINQIRKILDRKDPDTKARRSNSALDGHESWEVYQKRRMNRLSGNQ